MGSLDHVTRRLIVHTSATKRSSNFIAISGQLTVSSTNPATGRP